MPTKLFEKGNTFSKGRGRPKGALNKEWSKLHYWMDRLNGVYGKLKERDQAYLCMEAWKT